MEPIIMTLETAEKIYDAVKKIQQVYNVSREMKTVAESEGKDQIFAVKNLSGTIADVKPASKVESPNGELSHTDKSQISDSPFIDKLRSCDTPIEKPVETNVFVDKLCETAQDSSFVEKESDGLFCEKNDGVPTRLISTRNEDLEGSEHPVTGVPFERKIITLDSGEKVEGVFPVFESTFDAELPKELYCESDAKQFSECAKQLKQYFIENPEFREQFSERAQDDIMNERTPPYGYTWHHNEEPGRIQLVNYDTHAKTGHHGGRTVWGGGNENR